MNKREVRKVKDGRQLAASALIQMEEGGYSNIVLNNYLSKSDLDTSEKNFATRLFYGVVERKITLLYIIDKYVKKKMDLQIKIILMLGVYQLLYIDGVKDYAIVDETVKLCRVFGLTSATGFVNAVLRNFLRDDKKILANEENSIKKLSIEYSCSEDIVKDLLSQYTLEDVKGILESSLGRPRVYGRVNTIKTTRERLIKDLLDEGIKCEPSEHLKNAIYFTGEYSLENSRLFKDGYFHIQDLSSQMAIESIISRLKKDKTYSILDTCAAPGGKSFTIAEELSEKSSIKSCDIYDFKLDLINSGKKRLNIKNIETVNQKAERFNQEFAEKFDVIICDLPCSGIGIISKKPEIKYKSKKDYRDIFKIQKKILENSSKYLKSGGILLYSTCTLFKNENDDVVLEFLENHENFKSIDNISLFDKCYKNIETKGVTILPKDFNSDGFYIALLEKE